MMDQAPPAETTAGGPTESVEARKPLSDAARRALAEAAERRAEQDRKVAALQQTGEHNGRGGLDPVRYDDWEIKGIASDF